MNSTRRATLIWSLGAVIFSLIGIYVASGSNGVWYSLLPAVILFLAGAAFTARAVLNLRSSSSARGK